VTAPTVADLSSAIHGLAGRSSAVDSLMTFLAQDPLYAAVLVLAVQWFASHISTRPDREVSAG